jgi:predicted nucleic acid-binding protein
VALVRTNVSEEIIPSITKVTRIGKLGKTLTANGNRNSVRRLLFTVNVIPISPILVILMMEALRFL